MGGVHGHIIHYLPPTAMDSHSNLFHSGVFFKRSACSFHSLSMLGNSLVTCLSRCLQSISYVTRTHESEHTQWVQFPTIFHCEFWFISNGIVYLILFFYFLHDDELILRGLRCYLSVTLEVRWSRHLLSEPHTSYSAMELSFSLILLNSPQTYQIIVYASNAVATNTKKEQIVSRVVYKYFAHRRSLEP